MWNTTYGERTLVWAERLLVASESWALTDAISEAAYDGGASFGILLFDRLTWQQQMLMVDQVLPALVEPTIPAPPNTALLDATVAAIYAQMVNSVQMEIDMADPDEDDSDNPYSQDSGFFVRQSILSALTERIETDEPMEEPFEDHSLSVECDEIEEWELVIEILRGRVLADEDWQMEAIALDLAPPTSQHLKQLMGIQGDYFIDIPPDVTDEEAEAARLRIAAIGKRVLEEPQF